jgi:hypothetical protein
VYFEQGIEARAANRASSAVYKIVQGTPGPILSQQGSFALFSHGGIYIQLFHFAGLSRAGIWDQTHITGDISQRIFPYVITQFPVESSQTDEDGLERFTPEMILALRQNYQRVHSMPPYFIYAPKSGAGREKNSQ